MLKNCENCGGKLHFSPKDKGNVCESCGSIFPVPYNYNFNKKTFDEHDNFAKVDEFAQSMKSLKCKSCGANVLFDKFQIQTTCPYCGSPTIEKNSSKKLMYIDSIIPFAFSKKDCLSKFKAIARKKFYVNKKILKNIAEKDIKGVYVNAFVFDMVTYSTYSGIFSYKKTEHRNGETRTRTIYKNVSGILDKTFKNITVEANSNLDQKDLFSIMPFDYGAAVDFKKEFMYGYMLEYEDKMLNACVEVAEQIVRNRIKDELLKKHGCDNIERLDINTDYIDRKYNYCLLPVYFVNTLYKDKNYKLLMNGQTAKTGKLPKDKVRVFFTVLLSCILIVGIILLIMYLN